MSRDWEMSRSRNHATGRTSIPPLRERAGDMPLLVEHYLEVFQRKMAKLLKSVDDRSMARPHRYAWPDNIRELQHVLERAKGVSS